MAKHRQYGIVSVSVNARRVREPDPSWETHFPPKEWLEAELASAHEQAGDALRPYTDWGWYVDRMLANLGLMKSARASGDVDQACLHAVELGQLMAESRIKFEWESHALVGKEWAEAHERGGAETRKAPDDERRAIVEAIMAERGKGVRDACRTAATRHAGKGSESSFRQSFYKNPSKPSD